MSEIGLPKREIQAILAAGFADLSCGEFLLLAVDKAAEAKAWLRAVLDAGLVTCVGDVDPSPPRRHTETAALAFSHAGLLAMGARACAQQPFPSIFSDGMGHPMRARGLGDADAHLWRWADAPTPYGPRALVHVLVAHYRLCGPFPRAAHAALFEDAALHPAFKLVARVPCDPAYFKPDGTTEEAFGFRDGISQPVVAGLLEREDAAYRTASASQRAALALNRIAPGEFLLGQPNEYGELAHSPQVEGWRAADAPPFGAAGSYLAVRQIRQDVAAFTVFDRAHPGPPDGPRIVEKMIGRRFDGTALSPHAPHGSEDFGYAERDPQGYGCPRGAHMRRAHPRDSLGQSIALGEANAKLHRMLRRGRPYRIDARAEQGLFFMALNADLERQFALVQQRWISQSRFGDLADETDPLLGQIHRAFTVPHPTLGQRLTDVPRFTEVVGGGYFFLPAMGALRHLAQG